MSFRDEIQALVAAIPGATAAVLMGMDGIPIDTFQLPQQSLDVPSVLAALAASLQQLSKSSLLVGELGGVEELVINGKQMTAVLRPLTESYFLAMLLAPGAISGKARFLMRLAAPRLIREL